jgi:error-prone DNA polymerase
MLGSQPMGFYQPAQLVRDARDHGVEVRPADILLSGWDSALEKNPLPPSPLSGGKTLQPVRLGLRQIHGLKEKDIERLIEARQAGARTLRDLAVRAGLSRRGLELIAEADALRSLGLDRRAGLWAVKGLAPEIKVESETPLLALMGAPAEGAIDLPAMALPAHVAEDYRTAGLSLKAHPCAFFRPLLQSLGAVPAEALKTLKDGRRVAVGGLVLVRQRPGTAKGVVFVTLEDETGPANAVVWRDVFASNRRVVMGSGFLVVHGRLQRAGEVIHVVAERFTDLTERLGDMRRESGDGVGRLVRSRDFH